MKEIEFRLWSVKDGLFLKANYFAIDGYGCVIDPNSDDNTNCHFNDPTYYIITQYTSLKDKNGKKIFDGDIIRYRNKEDISEYFDGEVIFKVGAFMVLGRPIYVWAGHLLDNVEIIGNIFENIELLNKD